MTALTLDDAWSKLRWARRHLEIIRLGIEGCEKMHDYSISAKVDADAGEYIFHVHGLKAGDPEWALRIGDCLRNARTALDYLMVRLVCVATGKGPMDIDDVQFPICTTPMRFQDGLPRELCDNPGFSSYFTCIKQLQPFNKDNPAIWGDSEFDLPTSAPLPVALLRLYELNNIDRYRNLHTVWHCVSSPPGIPPGLPAGYVHTSSVTAAHTLTDDAELGRWTFETPLPSVWVPTAMDMRRAFPLAVSIGEPLSLHAALEVLPFCLWGVETTLELFEPVFLHGRPPLPVTASLATPPDPALSYGQVRNSA